MLWACGQLANKPHLRSCWQLQLLEDAPKHLDGERDREGKRKDARGGRRVGREG